MSPLIVSVLVVETAVLVVLSVLVLGLLRSYATMLERLHRLDGGEGSAGGTSEPPPFRTAMGVPAPAEQGTGRPPPVGGHQAWAPAHDIVGQGLSGEVISVRTVGVRHDTVIVFLSSGCAGCGGFFSDLAERPPGPLDAGRLVIVTKGPEEESPGLLRELSPPGVDLIMSSSAWADYRVPGSPYVIVVDGESGRIKGEGSGTSLSQVSGLMRQALGDSVPMTASRAVIKPRADTEREVDVDRTLLAAGIGPGHPSLYAPAGSATVAGNHQRLDLIDAADSELLAPSRPRARR